MKRYLWKIPHAFVLIVSDTFKPNHYGSNGLREYHYCVTTQIDCFLPYLGKDRF